MSVRWELVAEIASLASGLSLAWPAVRLNKYLRIAHEQSAKADTSRSANVRGLRRAMASAYSSPQWNRIDGGLTLTGVALCVMASAIKIAVFLQK